MNTEIEGKWLNVDVAEFRKKLTSINAELIAEERLMVRRVFDYPDGRLARINGWVRLRNEGDKITLSYKQLNDRSVHGTKEVSLVVDDYDEALKFLKVIGLELKSLQETKRESWKLGNTEIEIDTWPWIPSFVEIEALNEAVLIDTAKMLGLDYSEVLHGSVETAYQDVYNVTEEEIDSWDEIKFSNVPKWLKQRRKN